MANFDGAKVVKEKERPRPDFYLSSFAVVCWRLLATIMWLLLALYTLCLFPLRLVYTSLKRLSWWILGKGLTTSGKYVERSATAKAKKTLTNHSRTNGKEEEEAEEAEEAEDATSVTWAADAHEPDDTSTTAATIDMKKRTVRFPDGYVADILVRGPDAAEAVLLFIPGNPGIVDFYQSYAEALVQESGNTLQVVIIGHAGHGSAAARAGGGARLACHNLDAQITHHIAAANLLLEQRARPVSVLFLGGHSIGGYIALEVAKSLEILQQQQQRSHPYQLCGILALFPTLHHIGSTPNGRRLYPGLRYFRQPLAAMARELGRLPLFLQRAAIRAHLPNSPPPVREAALQLLDAGAMANALWMGCTEMEQLLDLDENTILHFSARLGLYYGATDDWVTLRHSQEVERATGPGVRVVHCKEGIPHAFVLNHSNRLAEVSWDWIAGWLDAYLVRGF